MNWQSKFPLLILAASITVCSCNREHKPATNEASIESPVSSHYEHLKELAWWVGDWVDDEKDIDMTLVCKWDKNKNFLIQNFTIQSEDRAYSESQQIITWDQADDRIRSWVFDSDGGFGESFWSQDENIWYSSIAFTLPDGGKATATHIYTKVDDDTYTFSSVARDVGGKILPDIGPFKVIRKK